MQVTLSFTCTWVVHPLKTWQHEPIFAGKHAKATTYFFDSIHLGSFDLLTETERRRGLGVVCTSKRAEWKSQGERKLAVGMN